MTFELVFKPISAVFLLGVVMSALLTVTVFRRRPAPGALYFALFSSATFFWSIFLLLEYSSPEIQQKILFAKIESLGLLSTSILWLFFTLEYTGHHKWRKHTTIILLSLVPAITLAIIATNDWHGWYWSHIYLTQSTFGPTAVWEHGFWFWISAMYQYALVTVSLVFLMRSNPEKSRIKRKQLIVLILGAITPFIFNAFYLLGAKSLEGFDFTSLSIALSSLLYVYSIFRYHLLSVHMLARNVMIDKIPEGIIVLDANFQITDLNFSAERMAGTKIDLIRGKLIDAVWPDLRSIKYTSQPNATTTISCSGSKGQTFLETSVTAVLDSKGNPRGQVIVLRDVTDITQAQVILKRKLEIEQTVAHISNRFVGNFDIDKDITQSLAEIGYLCRAGRAYLFLISKERNEMSNTHEWCADGVSAQMNNLQDLSCEIFPWWMSKLHKKEVIYIPSVDELPAEAAAEKNILSMQNISSVLVFPVFIRSKLAGFIGLDNVFGKIPVNEENISIMRTGVEIVGNALERYQAEQRIHRLFEEEKKQREELQEEVKARSQFIKVLAHDLRTPLTPILLSTETLNDLFSNDPESFQARIVKNALSSAHLLKNRLEELLDLAKFSPGNFTLKIQMINTSEFLRHIVNSSQIIFEQKRQRLECSCVSELPQIEVDPFSLEKVFFNLLSNASRYSPEDSLIIFSVSQQNNYLLVEVKDQGTNISSEDQRNLFLPYHRAEQDRQIYPGIGLGLAVSRQIVEAHKGKIWVESEPEKGSTFKFTVPIITGSMSESCPGRNSNLHSDQKELVLNGGKT